MDKIYDPINLEQEWYKKWEDSNNFGTNNQLERTYCIMLPPPNVTGTLHMGHAFQDTIMDLLIRYHRMSGYNTLWQPGTDHAGIATQMVVEKRLNAENITKEELGREKFIEKIWEWKQYSGDQILSQMKRLGASADWSRSRFTMDEQNSKAVATAFINLFDKGLIYKGQKLVNWDPVLKTAVSDLEVLEEETEGFLYHIDYQLSDSDKYLTVATTRPETLFGDVAVAVNPNDTRYQAFIGKTVVLPISNKEVPIIADEHANPEFGTGCVKITPGHDFNDYEVAQRNNLPLLSILTDDAKLNTNTPQQYQGLSPTKARELVLGELAELGLLRETTKHLVKERTGDRTGASIEPYLTWQWFVKAKPLAEKAIEVVRNGQIKFVPENWSNTYYNWMENIQDWCISRQLWWGHRIPAWQDEQGNLYAAETEAEVRKKYQLDANIRLKQDEDVLDTWFSSALWPFATLGWPETTEELKRCYPTDVLVTGFDIIFFWVARMIMFGLEFTGKIPFNTVYVHGLIQDMSGQKMSKSKGNIIDPIDLIDGISLADLLQKRTAHMMQPHLKKKIEKDTKQHFKDGIPSFGTDALRFTFCALASTGRHIKFSLDRIAGYRNFCNKIWNATRYVLMHTAEQKIDLDSALENLSEPDKWIWHELNQVKQQSEKHIAQYRFDLLANTLYEFVWNEYCDWYVELSKPILKDGTEQAQNATKYTLLAVLEEVVRLMHPIMPFITEEIWQKIKYIGPAAKQESIMLASYPIATDKHNYVEASANISWLKQIISAIRNIRGEMNISPSKSITLNINNFSAQDKAMLEQNQVYILALTKACSINWLEDLTDTPISATALLKELKILIPIQGLIKPEVELDRINKELSKADKELKSLQQRLTNEDYLQKAPKELVEKEQTRARELANNQVKRNEQAELIKALLK